MHIDIMCSFLHIANLIPPFSKDPCGSKYNDDPFDVNDNFKPGLPENMKERIEALAKKKAEE